MGLTFRSVWLQFCAAVALALALLLAAWLYHHPTNPGISSTLSLMADFVPMAIALAGIIMSYRAPRPEHHHRTTLILIICGLVGTAILSLARIRAEAAHKTETEGLNSRLQQVGLQNDNLNARLTQVGLQNTQILNNFLKWSAGGPTTAPPEGRAASEAARRRNILALLRNEYILKHDRVSPGIVEGTEEVPTEWVNQRLGQLGEKWTVEQPPPPAAEMGQVKLGFGMGDDGAPSTSTMHNPDAVGDIRNAFLCAAPFLCWTEDMVQQEIPIVLNEHKGKRLFFMVANSGDVLISHPTIHIASQTTGVSVYMSGQRSDSPQQAVEFPPNLTFDLLPFKTSDSAYNYACDVTVDNSVADFAVAFSIFAGNLTSRSIRVGFHVIR